jgi:hypothetical protein
MPTRQKIPIWAASVIIGIQPAPRQIGASVPFDQAGHQSRCVGRRHQAGESPIAGYERGDGWARIAADAACRRWHRWPLGLPAAAGPRGGHPARQAPHRSLVRTGSAGPPAPPRGMLSAARMPEGRGHRRSPCPFLWPLARHARQGRCLHPGLAAASRGGRLRSGGLEVVTIGPLRSPIRVLEDLRERDPAPGPSQNHTISIPPPGPVPRACRGGQAVVHRCDRRPASPSAPSRDLDQSGAGRGPIGSGTRTHTGPPRIADRVDEGTELGC